MMDIYIVAYVYLCSFKKLDVLETLSENKIIRFIAITLEFLVTVTTKRNTYTLLYISKYTDPIVYLGNYSYSDHEKKYILVCIILTYWYVLFIRVNKLH